MTMRYYKVEILEVKKDKAWKTTKIPVMQNLVLDMTKLINLLNDAYPEWRDKAKDLRIAKKSLGIKIRFNRKLEHYIFISKLDVSQIGLEELMLCVNEHEEDDGTIRAEEGLNLSGKEIIISKEKAGQIRLLGSESDQRKENVCRCGKGSGDEREGTEKLLDCCAKDIGETDNETP